MKTNQLFILLLFILPFQNAISKDNDGYKEVPFQVTFFPPLGTNGINAGNTINQVSFNILAGYNSGLNGVEFGGLLNINRDIMTGVQFAGFSNITGGDATGLQFAGFSNINTKETDGLQFAGFSNINVLSTNGLQAAGFMNMTRKESKVVQLAGFSNFANSVNGVQIAGFSNLASGTVKGVQIAGFLNAAKKVEGVQLGVFNIADTITNGLPIGFLSIVRNGYYEFEVGTSEGLNTVASVKIGVKKFYNIFSIGMQYFSDRFRWGYGYGIGTHLTDKENLKVNLEILSYHINEGTWKIKAYNGLEQAKLTFARPIDEKLDLFLGPTFNLMVSNYHKSGSVKSGSDFPPYYFLNQMSGDTNLKYWFGFTAGLRIH